MNWVRRIRFILGAFWYRMFNDQDFLLGVEYLLSDLCKYTGYTMDNWVAGMFPMLPAVYPANLPYVVLLDVSTLHREWYDWKQFVNNVQLSPVYDEMEALDHWELGKPTDEDYVATEGADKGWVVDIAEAIPEPWILMDHVYNFNLTLTNGPDFKVAGNQVMFYVDPSTLNIPSVKVTTKDGELKVYWKLIGIQEPTNNIYPAVAGFMSSELNSCADIVWDIHQNGATYYNSKKLLAAVTDNVVCDVNGAVNDKWEEQGYTFLRIGEKIYGSQAVCNFEAGADVKKGDILFGDMKFYKGSDAPTQEEIPGVLVRTDAGDLVAENQSKSTVVVNDTNILPLTGAASDIERYQEICVRNSNDTRCPNIQVPSGTVNPYEFVMKTLRRGRTCAVRLTAVSLAKLEAAINVLRKSTNLGGLITMYVKDSSETANVTVSGFSADAGMGVVAVDATIEIQGQMAEARILP